MNQGGEGPHGVMSGTTGSGKTTALRTVIEAIMLGHPAAERADGARGLQGRGRGEAV